MTNNTEISIPDIKEYLISCSPQERLNFLSEIFEGYCKFCGNEEMVEKCQCWNDE